MTSRALPESIFYRDPGSGEFLQRRGTVSDFGRIEPLWQESSAPMRTMEIRYDRDRPAQAVTLPYIPGQDNSEIMPMRNNAVNKSQKWKEFSAASQDYSQSGTDIPSFNTGSGGAFAAGSDFPGQGFGYQYQSPATIAGSPSFNLDPDFDSPIIDRDLERYRAQHGLYKVNSPKILENIERLRNSLLRGV